MLCSLDFFSDNIDPHASSTTNEDRHSQIEIVQCIINNLFKKKKTKKKKQCHKSCDISYDINASTFL